MKKTIFVHFVTALLFSLPISSGQATPLGVNLIQNPSAEANGTNSNYNATIIIDSWEIADDTIAIPLDYGITSDSNYVSPPEANFPSETFGNSLFYGGNALAGEPNPIISQNIDISDLATEIDQGMLKFEISGYFGGYSDQDDSVMLYARCYDQNSEIQLNCRIGKVNALNRGNITTLLERSLSDSIPPGIRTIEFILQWLNASGDYQNGMADNLNFTLLGLPGFVVVESQGSTTVAEGNFNDSYKIKILETTSADVDIAITPNERLDIGAGAGQVLNITLPAGVEPNCVINVSAIDNNDFDNSVTVFISHLTSSADPNYNNKNFTVDVILLDNDDPLTFAAGSITMVIIPDTQYYVRNDTDNEIYKCMMQWIKDSAPLRNIQMVLHVGDITDDNSDGQWTRAKESMNILDGFVPYALAVGNHDGYTNTKLNDYFSISDNSKNQAIYGGSFETDRIENSYYKFAAPNGRKFLILVIEFEKRQAVLDWANPIIAANPDYEVVILTHEIMDELSRTTTGEVLRSLPDTPGSPQTYGFTDCHCGQELWDELTSLHKNIIMTFNGHYLDRDGDGIATGHRIDEGIHGNRVFQSLFNAQWISNGGDGWLRLVEFQPDGTIQEKSFSPYLNQWRTQDEYQFVNTPRVGDINRNSEVNFQDYVIFAQKWLLTGCGWCDGADINGNGVIDAEDLMQLSEKWLIDYTIVD